MKYEISDICLECFRLLLHFNCKTIYSYYQQKFEPAEGDNELGSLEDQVVDVIPGDGGEGGGRKLNERAIGLAPDNLDPDDVTVE